MALGNWPSSEGVGFNKKHDAPHANKPLTPSRPLWHTFRRRRLILVTTAILGIWLFIKNIPTDVAPVGERYSSNHDSLAPGQVQFQTFIGKHKTHDETKEEFKGQQYEGPLMFKNLVVSLRPHLSWSANNNVLFALPELRSTSHLVPIACDMARYNRSTIHVAILGKQDVGVEDLLKINGMSSDECPVIWHDARPDHPLESSQERVDAGIQTGLGHTCLALRPQVILVDDGDGKVSVDRDLLRIVADNVGVPMVKLPPNTLQSIPWLTSLDHNSLRKFNEIEIEILIQAHPESAGSLLGLLQSIKAANYDGIQFPRLTIELPAQIDPQIASYLESFRWPPGSASSASRVKLLHRLDSRKLTHAEASLRIVESFYPRTASNSHVLLLNPNVEVSPSYLHYTIFTLLEYKYGQVHKGLSSALFGLSLNIPDRGMDGQGSFLDVNSVDRNPLAMSQTLSSVATLIMGDKWAEFHAFMLKRYTHDPHLSKKSKNAGSIASEHSAWLSEALEMMQVQGLYTLYPVFAKKGDLALVTVHKELRLPPEDSKRLELADQGPGAVNMEEFMRSDVLKDDIQFRANNDRSAPAGSLLPLEALLPRTADGRYRHAPFLANIPWFTFGSVRIDWSEIQAASMKFMDEFSIKQGGCASLDSRNEAKQGSIDYLFCDPE